MDQIVKPFQAMQVIHTTPVQQGGSQHGETGKYEHGENSRPQSTIDLIVQFLM